MTDSYGTGNYSRPAIDVHVETAAYVFGPELITRVLAGANVDGRRSLGRIRDKGDARGAFAEPRA